MLLTEAVPSSAKVRVAVAVDLIGDLDATLGSVFADTLARLGADGTTHVYVTTRFIASWTTDGFVAFGNALRNADPLCTVDVDPGTRRMRAAFATAGITASAHTVSQPERARHLMIARHTPPQRLRRTRLGAGLQTAATLRQLRRPNEHEARAGHVE